MPESTPQGSGTKSTRRLHPALASRRAGEPSLPQLREFFGRATAYVDTLSRQAHLEDLTRDVLWGTVLSSSFPASLFYFKWGWPRAEEALSAIWRNQAQVLGVRVPTPKHKAVQSAIGSELASLLGEAPRKTMAGAGQVYP